MPEFIAELRDVNVHFETKRGLLHAVRDVDLQLQSNTTLAIVGESGAGKSVLAKTLVRQHQPPFTPNRVKISGSIRFHSPTGSIDLLDCDHRQLRRVKSRSIAIIGQEALNGLNPVVAVGAQIAEAACAADPNLGRKDARKKAVSLLAAVGIDRAEQRAKCYPHQLSGGQRQRVVIAMAAIRAPQLIIADEPTTALDVTVQARILELLKQLQAKTAMTIMFITHDLGVVAQIADRVAVMYAGQIVELASLADILSRPRHPYTAGLLATLPGFDWGYPKLTGYAPEPMQVPKGCAFQSRCPRSLDCCNEPPFLTHDNLRFFRCWNPVP
jgi:oligopeptide/dipeptide ABC transporter ATP-binding protein